MKRIKVILFIFFALFALTEISFAQSDTVPRYEKQKNIKNPEGTEFWLCFSKNYKDGSGDEGNDLQLELFITGSHDTKVNIDIEGISYKSSFELKAGTVKNIKLPSDAQVSSDELIEKLAVHITSAKPVSVYGLNRRYQTTDTYLGMPTEVLGFDYRVMCYTVSASFTPNFTVVSTENNTQVRITPSVNTMKHTKNEEFIITLNKGEVYQVTALNEQYSGCDLTGSYIKANKKIAVFSGHQCAYVPPKVIACNHLVEQMPPIPSWGKHFYLGKLKPRTSYTYRILANEPQTKIFEDQALVKTLKAGEFYESTSKKNLQITASKPILVAQYSRGYRDGDSIGDPMMLLISPTQQFLREYRFATPVNGSWKHYINVVVPTSAIKSMTVDKSPVDSSNFEKLGISRYSIGFINIPFGSHLVECAMPFGMYSYGFGYDKDAFDAYGTMGGQSFIEYEPIEDTIPPKGELINNLKKLDLIFRDDGEDDLGIKSIVIKENKNNNLTVNIPKFEEGVLQLPVEIKANSEVADGRVVLQVHDLAMNSSDFTICFNPEPEIGSSKYVFSEGIVENCVEDPGFQFGIFGRISSCFQSPDFSNTGNVQNIPGTFSDAFGLGGYGGFYIGRKLNSKLMLSGRLMLENFGGSIEAADSIIQHVRTSDNQLKPFQEARKIELNSLFLNMNICAEYYLNYNIYLLGGISLTFALSDAIELSRLIIIPEDYAYQNNSRVMIEDGSPTSLGSLNSIRLGVNAGVGFVYPITYNLNIFSEAQFNYYLSSMVSDADWSLSQLSFHLGLRMKIF